MAEFRGEPRPAVNVERNDTLSMLKQLLATTPEVFGDRLNEVKQAVRDAGGEIEKRGNLSQGRVEILDNLYRLFK